MATHRIGCYIILPDLITDFLVITCKHFYRCLPFLIGEGHEGFETESLSRSSLPFGLLLFSGAGRGDSNCLLGSETAAALLLSFIAKAEKNDG